MNVLSLFDGMSCGQIALNKAGIKYDNYFASEIDKYAIQITQKNYPNTIQLGDVNNINIKKLPKIDLIIGGSPCQGFSIAGNKLNFEDERSKLFFKFMEIKEKLNPKYFLLENVKMRKDIADEIDNYIGIKRLFINTVNFSPMVRKRYYWTNLKVDKLPNKDLKIIDILDNEIFDRDMNFFFDRTIHEPSTSYDNIITINPRDRNGKQTWQRGRVYDINGKCPTICASLFDLNISKDHKSWRKLTINECEKLQTVPLNYTEGIPYTQRGKMLGNGWTVDVIAHIFKNI